MKKTQTISRNDNLLKNSQTSAGLHSPNSTKPLTLGKKPIRKKGGGSRIFDQKKLEPEEEPPKEPQAQLVINPENQRRLLAYLEADRFTSKDGEPCTEFSEAERCSFVAYLIENPDQINLYTVCETLNVDYHRQYANAFQTVQPFRSFLINHIERARMGLIESLHKAALGKIQRPISISHAKYVLELIESDQLLPRFKTVKDEIPGTEGLTQGEMRKLGYNSSLAEKIKVDIEEEKVIEKAHEQELEKEEDERERSKEPGLQISGDAWQDESF